ncbi:MAG: transposase [Candidatus Aminicenantales bacterium]
MAGATSSLPEPMKAPADYLEFIARVTFHIPDRGQVMVRYYGLYANAHPLQRLGGHDPDSL